MGKSGKDERQRKKAEFKAFVTRRIREANAEREYETAMHEFRTKGGSHEEVFIFRSELTQIVRFGVDLEKAHIDMTKKIVAATNLIRAKEVIDAGEEEYYDIMYSQELMETKDGE